jgi:hypothetical protein
LEDGRSRHKSTGEGGDGNSMASSVRLVMLAQFNSKTSGQQSQYYSCNEIRGRYSTSSIDTEAYNLLPPFMPYPRRSLFSNSEQTAGVFSTPASQQGWRDIELFIYCPNRDLAKDWIAPIRMTVAVAIGVATKRSCDPSPEPLALLLHSYIHRIVRHGTFCVCDLCQLFDSQGTAFFEHC